MNRKTLTLLLTLVLMGLFNTNTPKTNATTPQKPPKIQLSARVESFKCKESVFVQSGGFESCDTEIDLFLEDLNKTVNYNRQYTVNVMCKTIIKTEDNSRYPIPIPNYQQEWKHITMYANFQKSYITSQTRFTSVLNKATTAKLDNVECKILNVRQF
jgi:hypothetical protein